MDFSWIIIVIIVGIVSNIVKSAKKATTTRPGQNPSGRMSGMPGTPSMPGTPGTPGAPISPVAPTPRTTLKSAIDRALEWVENLEKEDNNPANEKASTERKHTQPRRDSHTPSGSMAFNSTEGTASHEYQSIVSKYAAPAQQEVQQEPAKRRLPEDPLRAAIVMSEVLAKPVALRPRRRV